MQRVTAMEAFKAEVKPKQAHAYFTCLLSISTYPGAFVSATECPLDSVLGHILVIVAYSPDLCPVLKLANELIIQITGKVPVQAV